ncbi:MAG: threonine synthase [Flavobacteriales bacterium]
MQYYSLNKNAPTVSFEQAVRNGLASDRGLYFPENIPQLAPDFLSRLAAMTIEDMAVEVMQPYVGNSLTEAALREIVSATLCFDFPIQSVSEHIGSLELYHGPTLAFKDVGARFMARCLGHFIAGDASAKKTTVLVATSGDTGGAVADGFLGVEGIDVVILYPKGKVSPLQEKQLTTLGKNITALEVDGVFDDCQDMVKTAFLDDAIKQQRQLTSANSINVARWLPQMLYYFIAYKQLHKQHKDIVFAVPSGNFGNLCAGMMAWKMGLPIKHFVACTNSNKVVPEYLQSGNYAPKKTIPTISNAMDVGAPSNFIRIQEIVANNFRALKAILSGFSYSDTATRAAMQFLRTECDYVAEPHGAIGYLGLEAYFKQAGDTSSYGVFLETAHPIKFAEEDETTLDIKLEIPAQVAGIMAAKKQAISIATYADLKAFLMD